MGPVATTGLLAGQALAVRPAALPSRLSEAELVAHELAATKLGDAALWRKHGYPLRDTQAVA